MTSERRQEAKRRAVERGVPPFPNVPPRYRRCQDGRLEPDVNAVVVAEAFRLRAGGSTVVEVREFLREHGVERSFHGVQALLGSRVVLGELRFGHFVNDAAHPPIVDARTWAAVQRMRSPRGRRAKSERLLARLGVLRCGTCGARMVVGSTGTGHHFYRCNPTSDCPRRVTVSAALAERVVVDAVRKRLAGVRGSVTVADGVAEAEAEVESAERELDAAVRAFDGLGDVDVARKRLVQWRERRDVARTRLTELQAAAVPTTLPVRATDWDDLDHLERRATIRAVVERAVVGPGRGPDRMTIELQGD